MVGQWGIPGWNFCHYCCVPAHKNLFSRGGGGVCNYLLDHGHLQIYLWMIIAIQKCALSGEVVHLFVCFLSCSFLIIKLLFTISPGSRFWLCKGYLEVSGRCLECVWGPQTGVVYCLGGGVPINICHLLSGEKFTETSFQRTKYFALLTWSSGNTSLCLSNLLSK